MIQSQLEKQGGECLQWNSSGYLLCSNTLIFLTNWQILWLNLDISWKWDLGQGRAKPNFWTRNRNQWLLKSNFRTTKSKPICMNGIIQNQNQNQFLIYKKFEIKIKTEMQKAVLFKTETETNIRSYLVTMTS